MMTGRRSPMALMVALALSIGGDAPSLSLAPIAKAMSRRVQKHGAKLLNHSKARRKSLNHASRKARRKLARR